MFALCCVHLWPVAFLLWPFATPFSYTLLLGLLVGVPIKHLCFQAIQIVERIVSAQVVCEPALPLCMTLLRLRPSCVDSWACSSDALCLAAIM